MIKFLLVQNSLIDWIYEGINHQVKNLDGPGGKTYERFLDYISNGCDLDQTLGGNTKV